MAKMQGRIDGLEAKSKARDEALSRSADVSRAFDRLKDRPLGSDLRKRLSLFRKSHGAKAFKAYVDELSQTTGVLPDSAAAAAHFQGQGGEVHEVAMKYHDQGAEAVERASSFCAQHEQLKNAGSRISVERYVELNMARTS